MGLLSLRLHIMIKSGLILCDATLCLFTKTYIQELYEYLLKQNYHITQSSLALRGSEIILSTIILDRQLEVNSGSQQIKSLMKQADHFDDQLVNKFGAIWKSDD